MQFMHPHYIMAAPGSLARKAAFSMLEKERRVAEIPQLSALDIARRFPGGIWRLRSPELLGLGRGLEVSQKIAKYNTCTASGELAAGLKFEDDHRELPNASSFWRSWTAKMGTRGAPFRQLEIPGFAVNQNPPSYTSTNPCGIVPTVTAKTPFGTVSTSETGKGVAIVMRCDQETNMWHLLSDGVAMCVFCILARLQKLYPNEPITIVTWFDDENFDSEFHREFLSAFGEVVVLSSQSRVEYVLDAFRHVVVTPWNNWEENFFRPRAERISSQAQKISFGILFAL